MRARMHMDVPLCCYHAVADAAVCACVCVCVLPCAMLTRLDQCNVTNIGLLHLSDFTNLRLFSAGWMGMSITEHGLSWLKQNVHISARMHARHVHLLITCTHTMHVCVCLCCVCVLATSEFTERVFHRREYPILPLILALSTEHQYHGPQGTQGFRCI